MLTRLSIIAAYSIFVLNFGSLFRLDAANMVEKGAFLLTSILCVTTRPVNKGILMVLGLNVIMILLLGAATTYPDFSWTTVILSLNQITIIYALLAFRPTDADCDSFLITAAFLPVACAILGIIYQAMGLHLLWAFEFMTGANRFEGSLIPAYLSGLCMCGIFAALQLATAGRRAIFILLVPLNFVILILAGGRAGLAVTLFVCGISLFLSPTVTLKQKIGGAIGGVATLLVVGVTLGGTLVERFQQSGDNGRAVMWDYLATLIDKYPWTGIGFGHEYFSVPREVIVLTSSSAAHNDYYRLAVELGVVGMPLFYILLTVAVLMAAFRNRRFDVNVIACYLGFLFLSRTDNALATPAYFPLVVLALMANYRYGKAPSSSRAPHAAPPPMRFGLPRRSNTPPRTAPPATAGN